MTAIIDIHAREILDSRGNPTIEVDVTLEDGSHGPRRRSVRRLDRRPRGGGTSRRRQEALHGQGRAEGRRGGEYAKSSTPSAASMREEQILIDETMIELDGTPNKARLGANAILGVSLAVAKAAADASTLPLYRYVGGTQARVLPVPMMNIINGGAHADNPIDFQEFMILPVGADSIAEAVRMGSEVFHTLKKALKDAGHNTNVGDEGGFAPNLPSAEAALDFVMKSIEQAGFKPGRDIYLGLDCAATEFFKNGAYVYEGTGKSLTPKQQAEYLAKLVCAIIPSRRSRTACRRTIGTAGRCSPISPAPNASSSATICSSPMSRACRTASSEASPTRCS